MNYPEPQRIANGGDCCLCGRSRGSVAARLFAWGFIEACHRCYTRWLNPAGWWPSR